MKKLILMSGVILISLSLFAQNRGLEIAKNYSEAYTGWQSYTCNSKMILQNEHGEQTVRFLTNKNLEQVEEGDQSMIVFNSPRDVKGTAILTYTHKESSDDQWLFLPAIKRVKRIASNNKSGPFAGSEFAYEDLSSQEIEKYTYKYVKAEVYNNINCDVIERDPIDTKSGYKYMHVYHNPEQNYRIEKIVYFDRKGEKYKTLVYNDYQIYKDKYWFPGELHMMNVQTKKETKILFESYDFDAKLDESDMNQAKLRNAG